MSVYAKNLKTKVVDLPATGDIYQLEYSQHRTFLHVDDVTVESVTDVRYWIGPVVSDFRIDHWPQIPQDGMHFPEGVSGPILFAELTGQHVDLAVVSSEIEALGIFVPLDTFRKREPLTTVGGVDLTTNVTLELIYTTDPQFVDQGA